MTQKSSYGLYLYSTSFIPPKNVTTQNTTIYQYLQLRWHLKYFLQQMNIGNENSFHLTLVLNSNLMDFRYSNIFYWYKMKDERWDKYRFYILFISRLVSSKKKKKLNKDWNEINYIKSRLHNSEFNFNEENLNKFHFNSFFLFFQCDI